MKSKNILDISYFLTTPTAWYRVLEEKNLGLIEGETFTFDPAIGEGRFQYKEFQKGFWAQQMNFTLHEPVSLEQMASETNELFIITFYLTNASIRQMTKDKLFEFQYDNISVMLSSSAAVSHYNIPANETVKVMQLGFTRDWLFSNAFDDSNSGQKDLFTSDQPIYLAENLDHRFKHLVNEMDLNNTNRLVLFSYSLQLLNTFFSKLENRQMTISPHSRIHHVDLENLLQVRTNLDSDPLGPFSLELLSQQSGMSLSKFKRLFKQVFGVTPYQYHLQNKMAIAMERLLENHTVSEVAFLLGYNNLSHFSKAFKKQYGKLPSEVQKSS